MNKERQQPAPGPAARLRERPPSRQGRAARRGRGSKVKDSADTANKSGTGGTRGTGLLFKKPTLWGRACSRTGD